MTAAVVAVPLITQPVNAPTAPGYPLAGRQWSDVWPLHSPPVQRFLAALRVPPARPSGPGRRHAKGGGNGELLLLVVVKHAFPRHRAGGDVYVLAIRCRL